MSDLNVTTISNSNIAKTDKLLAFNNSDSKAASIQDVVQLVPGVMAVATCSTAGNVATKAVTCDDWNNKPGQSILVEFSNANSADNVTLSINSGTAIPVYYMNTATEQVSGGAIPAGAVVFTLNAAGNKFYAHVTKLIEGAGVKIDGSKIEAVNDLPTDAVLHYSFDDLPDYPDGTAVARNLNGNTYNVPLSANGEMTTDPYVAGDNKIHISNVNGNANYLSDISTSNSTGMFKALNSFKGEILIVNFKAKTANLNLLIEYRVNATGSTSYMYPLGTNISIGTHKLIYFIPREYYSVALCFYGHNSLEAYTEWELLDWYIGDGSYSTPIIDNANGKWNSVSQSGIAVQGVSGKAIRFLGNNYIKGNLPWKPYDKAVFTVSCWIKDWDSGMLAIINDWENYEVTPLYFALDNSEDISALGIYAKVAGNYAMRFRVLKQNFDYSIVTNLFHIVGVFNGENTKVYINGKELTLEYWDTFLLAEAVRNNQYFQIGRCRVGNDYKYSKNEVDDFLIFDRALTEKEVLALYYNKANTPKYFSKADYLLEQIANNS